MPGFTLSMQILEPDGKWWPIGPSTKLEAASPADALACVNAVPLKAGVTYRIKISTVSRPDVFSSSAVTPTLPDGLAPAEAAHEPQSAFTREDWDGLTAAYARH